MASVPRQEDDLHSLQTPKSKRIRWLAERGWHRQLTHVFKPWHRIKAAAADHPNAGLAEIG